MEKIKNIDKAEILVFKRTGCLPKQSGCKQDFSTK